MKIILNEIDFNNDGLISFSEFTTVTLKHETELTEDSLKKAFNLFDLDGNGYITTHELKQVLPIESNIEGESTSEFKNDIWEQTVAEVDEDCDGMISFVEFKKMMTKFAKSECDNCLLYKESKKK